MKKRNEVDEEARSDFCCVCVSKYGAQNVGDDVEEETGLARTSQQQKKNY